MAQEGWLIVGLTLILTAMVKRTVPNLPEWTTPVIAFVVAAAAVFLGAETVWAHQTIVGGVPLDELDTASKITAGLFLGTGGAGALHEGLKAVHNIGENKSPEGPA